MKIVIIGAGISGLSAYLFLKKHLSSLPDLEVDVNIYEAYDVSEYIHKSVTPNLSKRSNPIDSNHDGAFPDTTSDEEPVFTPEAIGSAIGIARNGLNVLSRLFTDDQDESAFSEILADMIREGYPTTRWQMHSARGWKLADISMVTPESRDRKVSSSHQDEQTNLSWADSQISLIMISRQAFWAILLRHVVRQAGVNAIQHKKVVDLIIPSEKSTDKTIINFADGSSETADLVIGADGLKSIVRTAMFSAPTHQQQSTNTNPPVPTTGLLKKLLSFFSSPSEIPPPDCITPHYTNLVGIGGFIPSSLLTSTNYPPNTMSVAFGPNGFFGYGYITSSPSSSSPSLTTKIDNSNSPFAKPDTSSSLAINPNPDPGPVSVFWSTFSSPKDPTPFRLDNLNDSGARSKPYEFNKVAALKALVHRHRGWKNPSIQAIVSYLESCTKTNDTKTNDTNADNPSTDTNANTNTNINPLDSLGFYPTYTTPLLPTYSFSTPSSAIVLVGDAAHALHPSSGQGACQALEDAEILALLLRDHLIKIERDKSVSSTSDEEVPNDFAGPRKTDAAGQPNIALPARLNNNKYLHTPLSHFNALRIPRLTSIHAQSSRTSQMKQDMGFAGEMLMYAFIWLFARIGGGKQQRELGGYDLVADVRRVIREGEGRGEIEERIGK